MSPQIFKANDRQSGLVRRFKVNARRHTGFQGLAPAEHTKAPFVAVL
jgi:hypothetical protein